MNFTQQPGDSTEPITGKWVCKIMAAEGVVGILGNALVCFVILRAKTLHDKTNYLLVNLAAADMLLCLQVFLFYLIVPSDCAIISSLSC